MEFLDFNFKKIMIDLIEKLAFYEVKTWIFGKWQEFT